MICILCKVDHIMKINSILFKTQKKHLEIKFECEKCNKVYTRKNNHPNYHFKDKSSDEYGEALLAAIVHFNSNNLGRV